MKDILIDTNLLVLFVVGVTSPDLIGQHKRLRAYDKEDFNLLKDFLIRARKIIVTPNILTETSNLLKMIAKPARNHIFQTFQDVIEKSTELYKESANASKNASFLRLGLTDAVLLTLQDDTMVLLTVDLDLYLAASRQGLDAVNFNHYRDRA